MDSQTSVSSDTYFALRFQNLSIDTKDPTILSAITVDHNCNLTVEAWVQPDERTDLDAEDECVVVRHFGRWELGFLGDGRVYGKWIYCTPGTNAPLAVRVVSPRAVDVGGWLYVSLTVASSGQLSLYLTQTLLAQSPVQPALQNMQFNPFEFPDSQLQLGGVNFSGSIRNIIVSNVCKLSYNDPNDSSKNVNDFATSMYHATMHMLSENAIAAINLLHPMGGSDDPTSAIPLCCLSYNADTTLHMTEIPIPEEDGFQLQSLTSARAFAMDGYIDCGLGVIKRQNITFEAWVMPGGPEGLPNIAQDYTIASCGSSDDVYLKYNSYNWAVGWFLNLSTTPNPSGIPDVKLVFNRGGINNQGIQVGWAQLEAVPAGHWMHFTLSCADGTNLYLTVNGKPVPLFYRGIGFIREEIRAFPVIIGGYPKHFDSKQYVPGQPLEMLYSWLGYIKLVRIWKQALTLEQISSLYDLTFPVNDMDQLFLDVDLGAPSPADLSLNATVFCSPQTTYDDCVVSNIALTPMSVDDPRVLLHLSREAQMDEAMAKIISTRSVVDPDVPFLAGLLDMNSQWFELIDVAANVLFLVIDVLTKASVDKRAMADFLWPLFGRYGVQLATYITRVVQTVTNITSVGVKVVISACLDLFSFLYKSGFLKKLIKCFTLKYFGVMRLLTRFIPDVGTALLIADVVLAVRDISAAVARYLKRTAPKEIPLVLMLSPNPLTDRFLITQGDSTTFTATVDHQPIANQAMRVTLESKPAGTFTITPSSFILDASRYPNGVPITINCVEGTSEGAASINLVNGTKLIDFTTRKKASITVTPQNILPTVDSSGAQNLWTFEFSVIWNGPEEQNPTFTYQAEDDLGHPITNLVVKVIGSSVDPPQRATRSQTKRTLLQTSMYVDKPTKKAKISTSAGNNLSATTTVKPQDPQEIVDIYMINAGSGDAFYLHFQRTVPRQEGDSVVVDIFHATTIIDGGHGFTRGQLMFQEVKPGHLPLPNPPPTGPRGPFDLVICTHQDSDHVLGLLWMYRQMRTHKGLGPAGTQSTIPAMTWLNKPYGESAKVRSVAGETAEDGSTQEDADATFGVESLSLTDRFSSDPSTWVPYPRERSQLEAESLVSNIRDGGWDSLYAAAPPGTVGPSAIGKAGALIIYRAPSVGQVMAAQTNKGGVYINSASIVNEIVSTSPDPEHQWNSLWTGDAHMTRFSQFGFCASIGMGVKDKRHYTILKVGHHGSEHSNSKGFFANVTADHYLISCDGTSGNPRMSCIQWILDGHAAMRENFPDRAPANIWVSNPLDDQFAFNYQGGKVFQRNQSSNGTTFDRESRSGSLYFQLVNGDMTTTPLVLPGPDKDPASRRYVVEYTTARSAVKRAVIPNALDDSWVPLFPNDRTTLNQTEIQDLDANSDNAFFNGLVCSQSGGDRCGYDNTTEAYLSDYQTLSASLNEIPPLLWVKADYSITTDAGGASHPSFASFSCGSTGTPPTIPDAPNETNPKIQVCSIVMQEGEYINGVDIFVREWITGFTFSTNLGRSISWGVVQTWRTWLRATLRPSDDSYGMVGTRLFRYTGSPISDELGVASVISRLGVVWMPMDD